MSHYDLIVIGSGPGGYETAAEAAGKFGMKTALVENRELGGTCLNRGCIPTKTFLHTTDIFDEAKAHGDIMGITDHEKIGVNMATLQQRKNDVVSQLRDGVGMLMKKNKVDVYEGTGEIINQGHVRVQLNAGGTEELEADKIIIATGSVPTIPSNLIGTDCEGVITSDEVLDLDVIPGSMVILGGGVIGYEIASVFNSLGTKITVLKASTQVFNNMDKELGRSLQMILKKRGIETISGVNVTEITGSGGPGTEGLTVKYTEKEEEKEVKCDLVLLAKGRRAYTEGLFVEETADDVRNMELNRGKIVVNEKYETSVPGIYAIGDVIGGEMLAHKATAEGRNCVAIMNGAEPPVDMDAVPACIYTSPEIAVVGLNPDVAKAEGRPVLVKKYSMGANGKSLLSNHERGFVKIIADPESRMVLGGEMMCARATDMISTFAEAIVNGLTIEEMGRAMFPHPTFVEGIGELLRELHI